MTRRRALILAATGSLLILSPHTGLAAGLEWPTAGPYVNEIAHLLFLGAMLFFLYEIGYAGLEKFRGFRYLLWALACLALWNLDAFAGHWLAWTLTGPAVVGAGWSSQLLVNDFHTWMAFLTQLASFILLVPAFYLFYRGIKALAQMPRAGHR